MAEVPVYSVALKWAEGRTERLKVAADGTVVDAAEAAGLGLLYGYLYGAAAPAPPAFSAARCTTAGRRRR